MREIDGDPARIALGAAALDDERWAHLCMHGFYAKHACTRAARWHFGAMRHCDEHRQPLDEPLHTERD